MALTVSYLHLLYVDSYKIEDEMYWCIRLKDASLSYGEITML